MSKTIVNQNKKYTELICESCGGHDFWDKGNYLECENCHSIYKKEIPQKRVIYRQSIMKWISLSGLILLVILVGTLFIFHSAMKSQSTNPSYSDVGPGKPYKTVKEKEASKKLFAETEADAKWGLEHLDLTGVWTTYYFNSIQVATAQFDDKSGAPVAYTNGMLFSELVKKVGKPKSEEDYGNGRNEADFFYHGSDKKRGEWTIAVFIVYDVKSGMITGKDVMG
jgi:hypothetical protein